MTTQPQGGESTTATHHHGVVNGIVRAFLHSNLSLILIVLAALLGLAALLITPREEDPQIVVPLADIHVSFPGHGAEETARLVASPLEKLLYQIDGVEYVYSTSRRDSAVITVRFFVGQDRERSLVKIFKRLDENLDLIPPGVSGWVVKPIEIDDVPVVTLTLTGATADPFLLRRVGEEVAERLAAQREVSRVSVVGGEGRRAMVYLDPARLAAHGLAPLDAARAIRLTNVSRTAGPVEQGDRAIVVEAGPAFASAAELRELVIGVADDRPVFLKDVAEVIDGPEELTDYVRHGWGPAKEFGHHPAAPGRRVGAAAIDEAEAGVSLAQPAVTIAVAKKKGTNAVRVSERVLREAADLRGAVVPDDMELVITRNSGLTADEKVNELIEALAVAVFIVIALLTLGLGWREALIVAVAVPVVFGLTLLVNLLAGFSINRVTLFALILSLGLLVDDPIVDVENIVRHFRLRGKATREIVLEAVSEIRPPLITATLAVIVSFLPMMFITGMMGPYMRPMALNVPVAMAMSMLVAFTITPWLAYHGLRGRYGRVEAPAGGGEEHDLEAVRRSLLYRLFYPLMAPLLRSRRNAVIFLVVMGLLTVAAMALAALRLVPLKMLPFDNKNELLLVFDLPEGTTLERTDAAVRDFEASLAGVAEVVDFTSYVGVASPMDFNGLVRHSYLRRGPNVAEIRLNLVDKNSRTHQSHSLGLRERDKWTAIAARHGARLKVVETPPGPPVLSTLVAEVRGRPDHSYDDLLAAAQTIRRRLEVEPGVVDVDDTSEAAQERRLFVVDREKAALSGISVDDAAETLRLAIEGASVGTIHDASDRRPVAIELRLPRALRSNEHLLGEVRLRGSGGMVPLGEIGTWETSRVDQAIYHKDMQPIVYVTAEAAGRTPGEVVVDLLADRSEYASAPPGAESVGSGWIAATPPRPIEGRTFLRPGGGTAWATPPGIDVAFTGEGEVKITLEVFRDLGLAFGAALVAIYIILVAQTSSFTIPAVVMLAIPLTVLGVMPGFWLLNGVAGGEAGGYADPIFFTATGMIGMIALAGIVTRDSIILVDFIHLSLRRGRSLFDAIMESRVVRLRPILLTAGTAMLSAAPIAIDPIFSGLAWSLIFGLLASTVFTLFVIPVTYWLIYANRPGHGAPDERE